MSIRGTIFPCENAQSYPEAIGHVTRLLYPDCQLDMERALLEKEDLFKEYFLMIGSFSHAATRTIIWWKKTQKETWRTETFRVFPANEMQPMVKSFMESNRKKEGWLVSEWLVDSQSVRPHHECVFVEKREDCIKIISIDRRPNFEGLKNYVLTSFLPYNVRLEMYVSTQKRQHDWSQCPILTLDDLHQFYRMHDTDELYSFIESTASSTEVARDGKWKLYNSPYILPQFMRLAQSMRDVIIYQRAVVDTKLVSQELFQKILTKTYRKNPQWEGKPLEDTMLNLRITSRYIKYGRILVERILLDIPPVAEKVL